MVDDGQAITLPQDEIDNSNAGGQPPAKLEDERLLNCHNLPPILNILQRQGDGILQVVSILPIVPVDGLVECLECWDTTTGETSIVARQGVMKDAALYEIVRLGNEPHATNVLEVITIGAELERTDL